MPAPFRAILAGLGAGALVLRVPAHSPCIDLWPQPSFEAEVQKRIAGLDRFHPDYERETRRLVARAQTMIPDAEGRAVLPRDLAERAGLNGEIAFTGRIDYFQIWDAARLAAALAHDDAEDAQAVAA